MANFFKYSPGGSGNGIFKKGGFLIGNGTSAYGLTYYTGITPPGPSGYTIYLNKSEGGPSIYAPSDDNELLSLTNYQIAGASWDPGEYTTASECLLYFSGQEDKLCVNRDYEEIVTSGLVFSVDGGYTPSYPTTGGTVYDLSGFGPSGPSNGTLLNGVTYNSSNGGSLVFDGVNDYINFGEASIDGLTGEGTVLHWLRFETARTPFISMTSSTGYYQISLRSNRSANIETNTTPDDTPFQLTSGQLPNNTWGCLGARWNSNGTMDGFFNGTLRGSITQSLPSSYGSNNSLNIGWNGTTGAGSIYGKGRIGPVLVYDRALSDVEILQNYNAQKSRYGL